MDLEDVACGVGSDINVVPAACKASLVACSFGCWPNGGTGQRNLATMLSSPRKGSKALACLVVGLVSGFFSYPDGCTALNNFQAGTLGLLTPTVQWWVGVAPTYWWWWGGVFSLQNFF